MKKDNCIKCKTALTVENVSSGGWTCKDCKRMIDKRYRRTIRYCSKKEIRRIRDDKPCMICGEKLYTFFLTKNSLAHLPLSAIEDLDVAHFDCLVKCNKI